LHRRARADYDRAVALAPGAAPRMRGLWARATYRSVRGDIAGALADHACRVRIDRGHGWARLQRGELWLSIFERHGDRKAMRAARRDFEACVKRGNADAYGMRALARERERGNYAASRDDLERAIREGLGMRNWWTELARL